MVLTPASFKSWRERLYGPRGVKAAAEALGCSRTSIHAWETGWVIRGQHSDGSFRECPVKIPRHIALACQALANGLPPMN